MFVDDGWNVLPDQWGYLEQLKLLSQDVIEKIAEWRATLPVMTDTDETESEEKP